MIRMTRRSSLAAGLGLGLGLGVQQAAMAQGLDAGTMAALQSGTPQVGSDGFSRFSTTREVFSASIPARVSVLRTEGFLSPGDGGGATFRRISAPPRHQACLTLADGSIWEISDPIISPVMLGAMIDGKTDDTVAWQRAFSPGRPVSHPGGISIVSGVLCNERPMLSGLPVSTVSTRGQGVSVIRCMAPGVTPLSSFHEAWIQNVAFEFGQTAVTPQGAIRYACALPLQGRVVQVGGKGVMQCPAGGLKAASAGSTVVFPDAGADTHDYVCNNFSSFNQVFIIKEILSDTEALLFCPNDTQIPLQACLVRGNGFASLYRFDLRPGEQPTRIVVRDCEFRNIPGFGLVFTGAQQVDIDRPYGGGHLGLVACFPERGQSFYKGGSYHHFRLRGAMNFQYSAGIIYAGGLVDSEISQCQADPGGIRFPDRGRYFCSKVAQYALYNCGGVMLFGCSVEGTTSPYGIYIENSSYIDVRGIHNHGSPGDTIHAVGCYSMTIMEPRVT